MENTITLADIKKEFEIIPSVCAYEQFTDGIRIYHQTLAFYTYSKKYQELAEFAELIYIAYCLKLVVDTEVFESIIHHEGAIIKQLKYKDYLRIDKIKLLQEIKDRIFFYKSDNYTITLLNRVEWGEPRIYKGKFLCRRRLELYIYKKEMKVRTSESIDEHIKELCKNAKFKKEYIKERKVLKCRGQL